MAPDVDIQFFRHGVSSYTDGIVWDESKDSSYFCSDIFLKRDKWSRLFAFFRKKHYICLKKNYGEDGKISHWTRD